MGKCSVCGAKVTTISNTLGACAKCIKTKPEEALAIAKQVHAKSRAAFGLPAEPPKDVGGLSCGVCANDCIIGAGNSGFCGLVWNVDGRLVRFGGTAERGVLEWYYDELPTNCVSWWFCPGCSGSGYPKYAYKPEAEHGYANFRLLWRLQLRLSLLSELALPQPDSQTEARYERRSSRKQSGQAHFLHMLFRR
jgi:pyruvate formate lyase activating enzyme